MNIWISTNTSNSNSDYGRRKDITSIDYHIYFLTNLPDSSFSKAEFYFILSS